MIRGTARRGPALCVLCLCAAGLFPAASAAAPEVSPSKKAAVAFARAVESGDKEAVKATSVGTDEGYRAIKLVSDVIAALKRYQAAVTAKFGSDKHPADMTNLISSRFEAADERVDGDVATLSAKEKGDPGPPAKVRRVDGVWKVDLKSLTDDPAFAAISAEFAPRGVPAIEGLAQEAESGKYKTLEEAYHALGTVMRNIDGERAAK